MLVSGTAAPHNKNRRASYGRPLDNHRPLGGSVRSIQTWTGRPVFFVGPFCAIRRVAAGSDILDSDGNEVTATKLAVDCKIEHGESRTWPSIWSFVRMDQTVFWAQRRLAPVSLPLFQGNRYEGFKVHSLDPA